MFKLFWMICLAKKIGMVNSKILLPGKAMGGKILSYGRWLAGKYPVEVYWEFYFFYWQRKSSFFKYNKISVKRSLCLSEEFRYNVKYCSKILSFIRLNYLKINFGNLWPLRKNMFIQFILWKKNKENGSVRYDLSLAEYDVS